MKKNTPAGAPRKAALAFTAVLPVLLSCTAGPDYQPPQPSVPGAFYGAAEPPAPGAASLPVQDAAAAAAWWRLFRDPLLDALIERAVKSNLDLLQADTRIREARAVRILARAELFPRIDSGFDYRRSSGAAGVSGGPEGESLIGSAGGSGSRGQWQGGFDASWEIDLFGRVRRSVEASEADLAAAEEGRRAVLVSVTAEVARNYAELRGFQRELAVTEDNIVIQKKSVELSRQRHAAGFVGYLDVANAEAQVAATEAQVPLLDSSIKQAIYGISVLLGEAPAVLMAELSAARPIPVIPPEVPVGLPSALLRRRPDIRQAESALHAAVARIGVAEADLFPRFSLTAAAGLVSDQLKGIADPGHRYWSVLPAAAWPLFDAGRVRANIAISEAQAESALIAYRRAVLTALQEVERALVAYTREQQHGEALRRAVKANKTAVDLATTLYSQGQTDFLSVIVAKQALYQSEDALAQSERNTAVNLIALYKALGGGWQPEAPPQPDAPALVR